MERGGGTHGERTADAPVGPSGKKHITWLSGGRCGPTSSRGTASEREGNNLNPFKDFYLKARSDSGPDCLMCRKRVWQYVEIVGGTHGAVGVPREDAQSVVTAQLLCYYLYGPCV